MSDIIRYKDKYYNFFRWHRHYSFHETSHDNYNDEICTLCAMLNNVTKGNVTSVYMDIHQWWNGSPDVAHWSEPQEAVVTEEIVQTKDLIIRARNIFSSIYTVFSDLIV